MMHFISPSYRGAIFNRCYICIFVISLLIMVTVSSKKIRYPPVRSTSSDNIYIELTMVHRTTSHTYGESPSFLQVIGIIIAVVVGCAVFICVALLSMSCCVLLCCPRCGNGDDRENNNSSRENRSRPFFTNLNVMPRRDVIINVNNSTNVPQYQPAPTAPYFDCSAQDVMSPTYEETQQNTRMSTDPPSYSEAIAKSTK